MQKVSSGITDFVDTRWVRNVMNAIGASRVLKLEISDSYSGTYFESAIILTLIATLTLAQIPTLIFDDDSDSYSKSYSDFGSNSYSGSALILTLIPALILALIPALILTLIPAPVLALSLLCF